MLQENIKRFMFTKTEEKKIKTIEAFPETTHFENCKKKTASLRSIGFFKQGNQNERKTTYQHSCKHVQCVVYHSHNKWELLFQMDVSHHQMMLPVYQ